MGIIKTDQWLQEDFEQPVRICEQILPYFKGSNAKHIYDLLLQFGMYRPSAFSRNNLTFMLDHQVWDLVDGIFTKYKNKWNGPDIPIFLFPLARLGSFFRIEETNKAGVSFPDKMFLFLSNHKDRKEIEALLVHEYHHVCRMGKSEKKIEEFTLLDSLIIEGLAEYAVLKNCGQEYLAEWCHMYSEKELFIFWNRYLKDNLKLKKNTRKHDELLYGRGGVPKLLGYAVGYHLIFNYFKDHHFSIKHSLITPASKFIE